MNSDNSIAGIWYLKREPTGRSEASEIFFSIRLVYALLTEETKKDVKTERGVVREGTQSVEDEGEGEEKLEGEVAENCSGAAKYGKEKREEIFGMPEARGRQQSWGFQV